MTKLPVLQITKDAYNFIFTDAKKILPMFAQYSTSMILLYIFLHLIRDHWTYTVGAAPSASTALILLAFGLLTIFLQMPMYISMVRTTATQEMVGKDYFNLLLISRTRKAFFTMLAVSGLSIFGVSLAGALILVPLHFFFASYSQDNPILLTVEFLAILIATFYVFFRLFLAIPSVALDSRKPIRDSWKISKGCVIRILGIFLLTCLPSIAWTSIVNFLFNVSFQTNPLAYGFLTLPQLYLGLVFYAGLGLIYKHLSK